MPTRVVMTDKITINKPAAVFFDYVSDLTNDPDWRSEVVHQAINPVSVQR